MQSPWLDNDGARLRLRQRRMLQCFLAQLLVQHVGGRVLLEAHAIGEESGA